jgi:uncharacterized protein
MVLEGTVTNVAAFGAFVDVGVHQDGLVHVSALANRFVSDPREVVKSGQVVRVKVLEADPERKRISLTLRLDDELPAPGGNPRGNGGQRGQRNAGDGDGGSGGPRPRNQNVEPGQGKPGKPSNRPQTATPAPADTAMAEALRRAGLGK